MSNIWKPWRHLCFLLTWHRYLLHTNWYHTRNSSLVSFVLPLRATTGFNRKDVWSADFWLVPQRLQQKKENPNIYCLAILFSTSIFRSSVVFGQLTGQVCLFLTSGQMVPINGLQLILCVELAFCSCLKQSSWKNMNQKDIRNGSVQVNNSVCSFKRIQWWVQQHQKDWKATEHNRIGW